MKIISKYLMFAACLALAASCSGYKYETVDGDPLNARIYTLDNGLKVYMVVNKDAPRIDAQVAVRVGSKNDPRETTGLAHYFEHLMFKGTDKFGTQNYELEKPMLDEIEALFEQYRQTADDAQRKAIYRRIDSISLEASKLAIPNEYDKLMTSIGSTGTNAYTSYDVTCYVENIPSNQVETWARIQAERFKNCVLRGFHTELETIYEEYNMHAVQDQSKMLSALNAGLFKNHPYNTDIIGLPEHLKNPSITNVRKYHDQWYVPNNMAVVLVGDFNPSKTIRIIDRYFSILEPNKDLKKMEYEPEEPIESPVVKNVYGKESPCVVMGWRFPGAKYEDKEILNVFSNMLYNGTAGLIDLDVNQQQKTLMSYASLQERSDYSMLMLLGYPKAGQKLDQVSEILLEQIEKIKKGEFSDDLLTSTITEMKLRRVLRLEMNTAIAHAAVESFINETPWEDFVNEPKIISAITREDIIRFANENFSENYVRVNKLQGKDPFENKIAKPAITPIYTNRDTSSAYLRELQAEAAAVKPIEPVFLDFNKDLSILEAKSGIEVLHKNNSTSDFYELTYIVDKGSCSDKVLPFAFEYLNYLGTSTKTSDEIQKEFYKYGSKFMAGSDDEETDIMMVGLGENMADAIRTMEDLIADVQPNPEALAMMKMNTLLERENSRTNQNACAKRLRAYGLYGPVNPMNDVLSNEEILALKDEDLIAAIRSIFNSKQHISYYGPMAGKDFVNLINETHQCPDTLQDADSSDKYKYAVTGENEVIIVPFDTNQLIFYAISNRGESYDPANVPAATMYNEYFGGGMNAIVFQEMREARGLAYSSSARYVMPSKLDENVIFQASIQTQNDKLIDALDAFDEIINEMPVSQTAFDIAKDGLITSYRTHRITKSDVLGAFERARDHGLDYDIRKDVYNYAKNCTLDDVVKFQQENVKDRNYRIVILGREKDMDIKSLSKYGKITRVPVKDILGY
ncbi:MAG: insulinase family protein [Bacteroidales bacterium]|nr:insulinase family protein [Bacteroidales bacterium]